MIGAIVHDPTATIEIDERRRHRGRVRDERRPAAEINATGKIVYGYNLRVTAAGPYRITFTLPNVNFSGVRRGHLCVATRRRCRSSVVGGGGGGGGGGKPVKPSLSN